VGNEGEKKREGGVLLMLLTLFFPFPCLSSLECPCDNCVSVSKALQRRSVFTAWAFFVNLALVIKSTFLRYDGTPLCRCSCVAMAWN